MKSDRLVELLDDYFGTREVRGDDWSDLFELVYPDSYWREFAEPGYEGRWNGLLVRGGEDVTRVATCVFPSDRVVGLLAPGTFLFSEHPIDYGDEAGFLPLARETFERMGAGGIVPVLRGRHDRRGTVQGELALAHEMRVGDHLEPNHLMRSPVDPEAEERRPARLDECHLDHATAAAGDVGGL